MHNEQQIDHLMTALLKGDWAALIETAVDDQITDLLSTLVLETSDEIVRQSATGALGALADIGIPGAVDALINVLERLQKSYAADIAAFYLVGCGDDLAAQALQQYLNDAHHPAHLPSVRALAEVGDPRAVEALIGIVSNSRQSTRHELVRVLGNYDDVRIVFPLLRLLHHDDERVQIAAKQGLESIVDKHAYGTLIEYLTHQDAQARRQAAIALGEIGSRRAIRPLMRLAESDTDPQVCQAIHDALVKLGAPDLPFATPGQSA
jgi:HEAT repeat protein